MFLILYSEEKGCDLVLLVLLVNEEPGKIFRHDMLGRIPLWIRQCKVSDYSQIVTIIFQLVPTRLN